MGIAIRTGCPLELNLPSLMWKPLVGDDVTPAGEAYLRCPSWDVGMLGASILLRFRCFLGCVCKCRACEMWYPGAAALISCVCFFVWCAPHANLTLRIVVIQVLSWHALCGCACIMGCRCGGRFADVESLHESHKKFMASVRELVLDPCMTPEAWKRVVGHTNLRFVTTGFDGTEVELFPGGRSVHVPWTSRHECVRQNYGSKRALCVVSRGEHSVLSQQTHRALEWVLDFCPSCCSAPHMFSCGSVVCSRRCCSSGCQTVVSCSCLSCPVVAHSCRSQIPRHGGPRPHQ